MNKYYIRLRSQQVQLELSRLLAWFPHPAPSALRLPITPLPIGHGEPPATRSGVDARVRHVHLAVHAPVCPLCPVTFPGSSLLRRKT